MRKILIVDDSKTIRLICEWMFKGLEDCVITADCAAAAREMIATESPDITFVDYTLPDADAYELVESIKTQTKVIMMGGTYAPFDENKARECGAVAVVIKPFKSSSFFEALDAATQAAGESASAPAAEATEAASAASQPHENVVAPIASPAAPISTPAPSLSDLSAASQPRMNSGLIHPSTDPVAPLSGTSSVFQPRTNSGLFQSPTASSSFQPRTNSGLIRPPQNVGVPYGDANGPITGIHPVSPAFGSGIRSSSGIRLVNSPAATPTSSVQATQSSGIHIMPSQSIHMPSSSAQNPAISRPATDAKAFSFPNTPSSQISPKPQFRENATPQTPLPSVSPLQQNTSAPQASVDPELIRAEVIAAVKSMLPGLVSAYLKKLFQAEIKPQIQTWVDTRVEALIKKMTQR